MENLKNIIDNLPSSPGVYQFFSKGSIIYIGKAKNLRSRVASYFNKSKYESYKVKVLAGKVTSIKYIVVDSETDALLLENNLIKKYQPKYNVLLKDDKTFPWICIKKENFPRVFSTRKIVRDGSEYFGPYTSALMVKTLIVLIRQIFQIRTCNYSLTPENIKVRKYKKCLEYHIGNCLAPCEDLQREEDYSQSILQIRNILKGNLQDVIAHLKNLMAKYAKEFRFEEAEMIKQKLILLERFKSKSTIVNVKLNNIDVFSFAEKNSRVSVNFLKVINGAIIQSHTVEVVKRLDETPEELMHFAIMDIREKVDSNAREIIVPFNPTVRLEGIKYTVPKTGDKKRLLELSNRNALQFFLIRETKKTVSGSQKKGILEFVQKDLQLKRLPVHIECFDNSNIQGSNPVAACVVFRNGKPLKSEYRHFNVKTVTGPNDFASMEEIVYRRYSRLLKEQKSLPELIVIDGGKGQLNAAVKSLKLLDLYRKIPVIGIAKRLEEIYFPNDPVPLYIDKNSPTLKLIQNLRNEAHRFGITFHRNKRSSAFLSNQLEQIPGVGKKTAEKLLKKFGSVENIKKSGIEELEILVGIRTALKVLDGLKADLA